MKADNDLKNKFYFAQKLFSEKKTDESIKIYKDILKENPNFIPALNNLGTAYEFLGNLAEAENYYFKCFSINSTEHVLINNLSNIYLKQEKFNQALIYLKKSLALNSNQKKIINELALCLFNTNKSQEAISFCKNQLKIDPNNNFLNKILGKNMIKLNNHAEGLNYLRIATGFIEFNGEKINII